jgi:hypothetical protein
MADRRELVTLDVGVFDSASEHGHAAGVRAGRPPASPTPAARRSACRGAPVSKEPLGGLWQMTRTGVILPARGALVVPAKYAPPQRRCPGRVEGLALPLAQRVPPVARPSRIP